MTGPSSSNLNALFSSGWTHTPAVTRSTVYYNPSTPRYRKLETISKTVQCRRSKSHIDIGKNHQHLHPFIPSPQSIYPSAYLDLLLDRFPCPISKFLCLSQKNRIIHKFQGLYSAKDGNRICCWEWLEIWAIGRKPVPNKEREYMAFDQVEHWSTLHTIWDIISPLTFL